MAQRGTVGGSIPLGSKAGRWEEKGVSLFRGQVVAFVSSNHPFPATLGSGQPANVSFFPCSMRCLPVAIV